MAELVQGVRGTPRPAQPPAAATEPAKPESAPPAAAAAPAPAAVTDRSAAPAPAPVARDPVASPRGRAVPSLGPALRMPPQPRAPARETFASDPPPPLLALSNTRVALLLPLSGANGALGEDMLKAAQLAMFDFANDRFEFLVHDTRGTPEGAGRRRVVGDRRSGGPDPGAVAGEIGRRRGPVCPRGRRQNARLFRAIARWRATGFTPWDSFPRPTWNAWSPTRARAGSGGSRPSRPTMNSASRWSRRCSARSEARAASCRESSTTIPSPRTSTLPSSGSPGSKRESRRSPPSARSSRAAMTRLPGAPLPAFRTFRRSAIFPSTR